MTISKPSGPRYKPEVMKQMFDDMEAALESIKRSAKLATISGFRRLSVVPAGLPAGDRSHWSPEDHERAKQSEDRVMAQLDSFMDNVGATVKFAAVKAFLLNPKLLGHIARDAIGKARAVEGKNRAAKRKTLAGGRKAQIQWRIKAAEWSRKNSAMACQDVLERLSVSGYIDIQDDKVLVSDGPDGEKKAILLSGFKKSLSSVMSKSRKNT